MSVITAIYNILEQYEPLRALLTQSSIDPTKKAIYEEWATNETNFPYMILSFSFGEGSHWGKNQSSLNIDIFTEGNENVIAEQIKNACINCLDRRIFTDPTDGAKIRVYYDRDGNIDEPTDNVSHWNVEFSLHHWRNGFIQQRENEGGFL